MPVFAWACLHRCSLVVFSWQLGRSSGARLATCYFAKILENASDGKYVYMRTCLLFFIIGIASGLYSLLVQKNVIFSCLNYFDCKSEHLFFHQTRVHGILEFQHDKNKPATSSFQIILKLWGVHKQLA
jgi:hypothetical protein